MRKAFTLIELIISIVIIGIAASALPTMIAGANKLEEDTVNQDIFSKSITVVMDVASRYWDASILAQDTAGNGAMIVEPLNNNPLFRDTKLGNPRPGFFARAENDFRKFYSPTVNASNITVGSGKISAAEKLESIDVYNGRYIDETAAADGAKVKYEIAVAYVPDVVADNTASKQTATWNLSGGDNWTTAANSTNLKRITVTASGRTINGQPMSVNFVYFSSNIGTPGLKTK